MVHSDLKPENILISLDPENEDEADFKIIDLGSSFPLAKTTQNIEVTTPEYLPPDILDYLDNKQSLFGNAINMSQTIYDLSFKH